MALRRLVYVVCDRCGRPAGTDEAMGDTASEARQNAKALGFQADPSDPEDLCPDCAVVVHRRCGPRRPAGERDEAVARAWDEGAEATADWMANNPGPSGTPRDPPRNPYSPPQERTVTT